MKKHCKKLMDVASKDGLMINDEKTIYMKLSRRDRIYQNGESVEVEEHIFNRVTQF